MVNFAFHWLGVHTVVYFIQQVCTSALGCSDVQAWVCSPFGKHYRVYKRRRLKFQFCLFPNSIVELCFKWRKLGDTENILQKEKKKSHTAERELSAMDGESGASRIGVCAPGSLTSVCLPRVLLVRQNLLFGGGGTQNQIVNLRQ
jgi:hypothetical protein